MTLQELTTLPVGTLVRMDVPQPLVFARDGEAVLGKYGMVARQWSGGTEISWEDNTTGSLAFSWQALVLHVVQWPRSSSADLDPA